MQRWVPLLLIPQTDQQSSSNMMHLHFPDIFSVPFPGANLPMLRSKTVGFSFFTLSLRHLIASQDYKFYVSVDNPNQNHPSRSHS